MARYCHWPTAGNPQTKGWDRNQRDAKAIRKPVNLFLSQEVKENDFQKMYKRSCKIRWNHTILFGGISSRMKTSIWILTTLLATTVFGKFLHANLIDKAQFTYTTLGNNYLSLHGIPTAHLLPLVYCVNSIQIKYLVHQLFHFVHIVMIDNHITNLVAIVYITKLMTVL